MTLSPDNPALTNGEAQPAEGSAPTAPQSPEEVEAIWRNRFSQRDRAHNAEVESLRRQMDDIQRSVESGQGNGTASAEPSYKARYESSQRELEQERQARQMTERRLLYPALAGNVAPDDPLWVSARDETLARLNATFASPSPEPTGYVDANNPARVVVQSKPIEQMSKDELLQELGRLAPGEAERERAKARGY